MAAVGLAHLAQVFEHFGRDAFGHGVIVAANGGNVVARAERDRGWLQESGDPVWSSPPDTDLNGPLEAGLISEEQDEIPGLSMLRLDILLHHDALCGAVAPQDPRL